MSEHLLPSGTILDGKWRVDGLLGRGGMGTVYAATHVRNSARVALKVLHPEVEREAGSRERFLREGYAANRVGHPGVVTVLDDGVTADNIVFLVMERLEGQPLDAVADAAGGRLSVAETLRYAIPWLEVLAAAHAAGIVHRDLKPENVFVCTNGVVKVLDFGLASVREAVNQKRLTTTGIPLGTPAFMPREQALAHWDEVDARSDVYSIGASLFTLLTGQLVHDGRTVPEIIVAVSTRPARPIRSIAPEVPSGLASVIDRSLQFRPEDRYAHAGQMLAALRAATAPGASFVDENTLPSGAHGHVPVNAVPIAVTQTLAVQQHRPGPHATLASGARGRSTDAPVSSGKEATRRGRGPVVAGVVVALGAASLGAIVLLRRPGTNGAHEATDPGTSATSVPTTGGPAISVDLAASATAASAATDAGLSPNSSATSTPSVAPSPSSSATTRPKLSATTTSAKPPPSATGSPKNCVFDELRQVRVCK